MARRKPEETSAVVMTAEQLQAAHDGALTTLHSQCVLPDIAAARQRMQEDLARKLNVSKGDVVLGIMDAISDARLLADPKAQIAGFREIGLLMGYYAPTKVEIAFDEPVRKVRERMQQMSDTQLQELIGEEMLDGDFYVVDGTNG